MFERFEADEEGRASADARQGGCLSQPICRIRTQTCSPSSFRRRLGIDRTMGVRSFRIRTTLISRGPATVIAAAVCTLRAEIEPDFAHQVRLGSVAQNAQPCRRGLYRTPICEYFVTSGGSSLGARDGRGHLGSERGGRSRFAGCADVDYDGQRLVHGKLHFAARSELPSRTIRTLRT